MVHWYFVWYTWYRAVHCGTHNDIFIYLAKASDGLIMTLIKSYLSIKCTRSTDMLKMIVQWWGHFHNWMLKPTLPNPFKAVNIKGFSQFQYALTLDRPTYLLSSSPIFTGHPMRGWYVAFQWCGCLGLYQSLGWGGEKLRSLSILHTLT